MISLLISSLGDASWKIAMKRCDGTATVNLIRRVNSRTYDLPGYERNEIEHGEKIDDVTLIFLAGRPGERVQRPQ